MEGNTNINDILKNIDNQSFDGLDNVNDTYYNNYNYIEK